MRYYLKSICLAGLLLFGPGLGFAELRSAEVYMSWHGDFLVARIDSLVQLAEPADSLVQLAEPVDSLVQLAEPVDSLVLDSVPEALEVEQLEEEYVHSPHKATVYAAVFPGAGQIYNKKYWKLPILYGGIGGLIYAISFNSNYYNKYRSAYRDFLIRDPGNTSYEEFIPPQLSLDDVHGQNAEWFQRSLQNKRRYYKRSRDLSYIVMVGLYVISIIDASVDAHFYDFDISDDLSFRVEPAVLSPFDERGSALGLQMRIQF